MYGKGSLSATNLAVHHHFNCDLYLHNVYHRPRVHDNSYRESSKLSKVQWQRGNDWEKSLFAWLDHERLLLTVPSKPLDPNDLVENIQADNRDHFFIAGLTFLPPQKMLDARFRGTGRDPVTFGLAKPDLLEIVRMQDGVKWRVVDAKASSSIKTSHHVQIYFYTLCLAYILPPPFFHQEGSAAVWLPPTVDHDQASPSLVGLKSINSTLLSSLDRFLFEKLPDIISTPAENVKWHYNPLCQSCPYEQDCKAKAVYQGELGSMPNISLNDAQTLKALLRISSDPINACIPVKEGTDIEDLHKLISEPTKLENLALSFPSTVKRSRRILVLPKKGRQCFSPVVEATRSRSPQVKVQRSLALPRHEDIAVVMSLVLDPSSSGPGIERYSINILSQKLLPVPSATLHGSVSDLVPTLALLIQDIIKSQSSFSPSLATQFYVWSQTEQSALQAHLINVALISTAHADEVRICIGALAQGASLLHTTYQPVLLSGALLNFLANSKRTKAEHKACLKRLGLSTEGSAAELRKRVDGEIRNLQVEGGRTASGTDNHAELGQLPRVVVLKREVERLVALPIPGYWDLAECASVLLPGTSLAAQCPSEEEIFSKYQSNATTALEEALTRRNASIWAILQDVRERIMKSGNNLLVNNAKLLSSNFMDICRQEHIRKLFFVQQFEVLTQLNELWRSRIEGCPDAPVLQYLNPRLGANGLEHVFHLVSGTLSMPGTDKTQTMYDKIIALDEVDDPSNNVPVEALFNDLAVSGLVFPLNEYTRAKWTVQHPTVQKEMLVADLRDIVIDGNRTKVIIHAWSGIGVKFIQGCNYRLSPRLVDFNTSKALAVLLEMDLRCVSDTFQTVGSNIDAAHSDVPLLQIILDPGSFGGNLMAEEYLKTGNVIQKLFRDLRDLGSEAAGSLILKSSQHRAAQKILSNRLSVIWGPPGTGKTYTIALSLLRLLDVQYRQGNRERQIIFITAMTHAAIDACRKKLIYLMGCYRAIDSLPTEWLNKVTVEQVLKGNEHPSPPSSDTSIHIYTGTTYQLYNFTKGHSFEVDCVIIDEAGQLGLSSTALVIRALSSTGRIIIAGDSEQLAPIMCAQYPHTKARPLFGSVLDCLMSMPRASQASQPNDSFDSQSAGPSALSSNVVQLTENFRLNPDLGEFVSTIYARTFKAQKVQTRQLARHLKLIENDRGRDLGIQAEVLGDVQVFLLSLSKVMLREPQTVLLPPGLHFPEAASRIEDTDNTPPPRAISLALLKLNARATNHMVDDVGYEVHVRGEAAVAAALVTSIQRCSSGDDIFVATPHRVQREAVKAALARVLPGDTDDFGMGSLRTRDGSEADSAMPGVNPSGKVTVDTIERLQGSEAAFVICLFSAPKSSVSLDLEFLLERRRLNVAISRAKTLCVVVASPEVLRPGINVLANEETAKGYAFLRAYEERAWSCELNINLDNF